MTLRAYDREDGKYVIHDDEGSPDAWMVVDPDAIMQDTQLASRQDWTPGQPDSHPGPQTDVDDWR